MKLWAIIAREYLQRARTPTFVAMTVLGPFLMLAMALMPALTSSLFDEVERVAIVDDTGRLGAAMAEELRSVGGEAGGPAAELQGFFAPRRRFAIELVGAAPESSRGERDLALFARLRGSDRDQTHLDGVLVLPPGVADDPAAAPVLTTSTIVDPETVRALTAALDASVLRLRSHAHRRSSIRVDCSPASTKRTSRARTAGDIAIGFGFATLLLLPLMVYGRILMDGIVQEKAERVIEVLMSSVSSFTLLLGKILGVALLGLTQVSAWVVITGVIGAFAPTLLASVDLSPFLRAEVGVYFLLFFSLGYFSSICMYAIVGSAAGSQSEAQQLLLPATMVMTAQWLLVMPVLHHPDGAPAVVLSLIPLLSPGIMFIRLLVSDVPAWQVGLAVVVDVATIYVLLRAAARIFRIGILARGKRPTPAELWRWLQVA